MVANWDAFMEPSGGAGYGTALHGTGGLVMSFVPEAINYLLLNNKKPSWWKGLGLVAQEEKRAASMFNRLYTMPRPMVPSFGRTGLMNTPGYGGSWRLVDPNWKIGRMAQGRLRVLSGGFNPNAPSPMIGPMPTDSTRVGVSMKKHMAPWKAQVKGLRGLGWLMFASVFVDMAEDLMTPGISTIAHEREQQLFADERHLDSAIASTQRQRALQAIHDSQMTVRNVLGSEAQFMHK